MLVVKRRRGHSCEHTFIVINIVIWEAISKSAADDLYSKVTKTLNEHGNRTIRRCGTNERYVLTLSRFSSFLFNLTWRGDAA